MSPYWWNFHWISGPARSSKKTLELAELLCGARGSAHVNRIKIMWLSCRFAIKQVQRTKQTSMDPKTKVPPACCHWKSDRSDCRLRWLQSKRKTIRPRQNAAFWFAWLATTRWDLRVKNVYTYQQKWLWLKIGYPQTPLVYHQFSHTFPWFSHIFRWFFPIQMVTTAELTLTKAAQQILPGVYSVVGKHDGCSLAGEHGHACDGCTNMWYVI